MKRILVGWLPCRWTHKCWNHFGYWFLRFGRGEITLAEGLQHLGMRAVPLWIMPGHFAYKCGNAREICHCSQVDRDNTLHRLCFVGHPRPACRATVHLGCPWGLRSAIGRHEYLTSCRTNGSPQQQTESKFSVSVLWCGRRNMKSPNPCEFLCYQSTKVR
jgi:hypothetical protein